MAKFWYVLSVVTGVVFVLVFLVWLIENFSRLIR